MRILVISNFYPPHYIGGYELACQDIVQRLTERGHDISVLTSIYGTDTPMAEQGVYRKLNLYWHAGQPLSLKQFAQSQFENIRTVERLIADQRPDMLYCWNLEWLGWPFFMKLLERSQCKTRQADKRRAEIPVVFAVSDCWMLRQDALSRHWQEYWQHRPPNKYKRFVKPFVQALLSRYIPTTSTAPLRVRNAHFFSHSLYQQHLSAGIIPESLEIIYHGVPVEQYQAKEALMRHVMNVRTSPPQQMALLYSGQVIEKKGVHTAIEAMSCLRHQKHIENVHLTIIGPQPFPGYVARLHELIAQYHLQDAVTIAQKVSRKELEQVYREHDCLLFPSIWEEPFSITLLEAMAHGLAVVSTPTGGSAEILRHGENSLVFPAENAKELADRIELLIQQPELMTQIRLQAIETVHAKHALEHIAAEIERYLLWIAQQNSR